MGDCRLRIVFAKAVITEEIQECLLDCQDKHTGISSNDHVSVSVTRMYSADTTVREVVESTTALWKLYSANAPFELWDCTIHPPKVITDWPMQQFPDLTGAKSKTLQAAGYFPSGMWMVVPRNFDPSKLSNANYDDTQYNRQQRDLPSSGKVEFKDASLLGGNSKPLPSQVMESVRRRFEEDDRLEQVQSLEALKRRRENQEQERRRRRERAAKLDHRIQLLEAQSSDKNKKVSDQVRRMLVKSRATGEKKLKQQDRLYFECLLDRGNEDDEDSALIREFRYFSPQDTFAKIASSFSLPPQKHNLANTEVLVKRNFENMEEYRRLPVTMRIYEAISGKYLTGDLDTIVVRWFSEYTDATPSILEDKIQQTAPVVDMADAAEPGHSPTIPPSNTSAAEESEGEVKDDALEALVLVMETKMNKGKKSKKPSAAALRVRNMQIKSKAIGDAKRIPKIDDRFFLEVVLVDKTAGKASSSFCFLANKDPLDRILQTIADGSKSNEWDFLVSRVDGDTTLYKRITDISIQLSEASAKGILYSFDRIILCHK